MNEEKVLQQITGSGIDYMPILPCDRIKHLIPLVKEKLSTVDLTREEVGVGLCAGAALAGRRPALLIQGTGAGSLLNVLCSLTIYYQLPLPILISWRGHYNETIEAQVPMGEALPDAFKAAGIETIQVEEPADIPLIGKGIETAFKASKPVAILLSPKIFGNGLPESLSTPLNPVRRTGPVLQTDLTYRQEKASGGMMRFDAIKAIAPHLQETAVVVNIGAPSKEYHAVADSASVFYMLGSLGLAAAIGLGIARFTDKKVVVIDGDGSILMTPNILQHIAEHAGDNLTVIAIDNGAYGSTGNQETATATGNIDLELLANVYGIRDTAWARSPADIEAVFSGEHLPRFLHVLTSAGNASVGNVALSGLDIKKRFMNWVMR
jgi:sulfopyruvate decarboxylase beta subunit